MKKNGNWRLYIFLLTEASVPRVVQALLDDFGCSVGPDLTNGRLFYRSAAPGSASVVAAMQVRNFSHDGRQSAADAIHRSLDARGIPYYGLVVLDTCENGCGFSCGSVKQPPERAPSAGPYRTAAVIPLFERDVDG